MEIYMFVFYMLSSKHQKGGHVGIAIGLIWTTMFSAIYCWNNEGDGKVQVVEKILLCHSCDMNMQQEFSHMYF